MSKEIKQPLILVTNDDGITSHGIQALVKAMRDLGEVIVVAPDSPSIRDGACYYLEQAYKDGQGRLSRRSDWLPVQWNAS